MLSTLVVALALGATVTEAQEDVTRFFNYNLVGQTNAPHPFCEQEVVLAFEKEFNYGFQCGPETAAINEKDIADVMGALKPEMADSPIEVVKKAVSGLMDLLNKYKHIFEQKACVVHDICYKCGANTVDLPEDRGRRLCDGKLWTDLIEACDNNFDKMDLNSDDNKNCNLVAATLYFAMTIDEKAAYETEKHYAFCDASMLYEDKTVDYKDCFANKEGEHMSQ